MAKYKKVDTDLKFVDREKEVEKFWNEEDIFKKSMENRKEGETYTFYDGPPTANGKPHIGHVLTRVIKDMIDLPSLVASGKDRNFLCLCIARFAAFVVTSEYSVAAIIAV